MLLPLPEEWGAACALGYVAGHEDAACERARVALFATAKGPTPPHRAGVLPQAH